MTMIGSKYKKIAIIGSAGVGKTTLLDALFNNQEIASNYQKIEEIVRLVCKEKGYLNVYDIKEETHIFRMEVLDRQIEAEDKYSQFIIDRSVIDAWIYFLKWDKTNASDEFSDEFYKKAYKQAQTYDLLVFLPIMFEMKDDGFRWTNESYQKEIQDLFYSTLNNWGLTDKLCEVSSSNINERTAEFFNALVT